MTNALGRPVLPPPVNTKGPAKFEIGWVPHRYMFIDPTYQRPRTKNRVKKIVTHFDPDLLGIIIVSKRSETAFAILDGGHRWEAYDGMGWSDQQMPCQIYSELTIEDEARIFVGSNLERARPKPTAIFKGRCAAGDPIALSVERIIQRYGYVVSNDNKPHSIAAIDHIMKVAERTNLKTLDRVMSTCSKSWPGSQLTWQCISGVGLLYARYGHVVNEVRLIKILSSRSQQEMIQAAKAFHMTNQTVGMLTAMVQSYNYRLSSHKLPLVEPTQVRFWAPVAEEAQ